MYIHTYYTQQRKHLTPVVIIIPPVSCIMLRRLLLGSLVLLVLIQETWSMKLQVQPVRAFKKCTTAATSLLIFTTIVAPVVLQPVNAFDNRIKEATKTPRSPGPKPGNLGLDKKNNLLRACLKPNPNCFSTTPDVMSADAEDDDEPDEVDPNRDIHSIPLWKYSKSNADDAFDDLVTTLKAYEPGQGDIDGGGFQMQIEDKAKRYAYVQFESLKRGYIDDLEVAVNSDGSVQVVSSSRLGYLDFQVNAKRLNFIADKLRKKGFDIAAIDYKSHPIYFDSNVVYTGPDKKLGSKDY